MKPIGNTEKPSRPTIPLSEVPTAELPALVEQGLPVSEYVAEMERRKDMTFTPERIAQLREILAKATQGEWETDTEKTDGEYGSGPDCCSGYHASIITAGATRICGTENSSDGEVREEFDEDGCYAWDEVAARNMKAAATAVNTLPAALDEIERLQKENKKHKSRGDNHWETLRSIRGMAREKDFARIIQWVNEAGTGYTNTAENTLVKVCDERNELSTALVEAEARIAELEVALVGIRQYASDTLTGAAGRKSDLKWYRDGVVELHLRARKALTPAPAEEGNG